MNLASRARCGAVWIVVVVLASSLVAQDGRAAVTTRIRKLVEAARSPKMQVGVVWGDAGAAPFAAEGDLGPLVPASNQKVLTSIAAVARLGLNHEFATGFYAMGPIANGALNGHLRVVGDGDPSFGIRDHGETLGVFRTLATHFKEQGVTRITGDILCDDAAFDQDFTGPDWPKGLPTTTYLAQVSALSVDEGLARLIVSPKDGGGFRVAPVPDVGTVSVGALTVKTVGKRQDGGLAFDRPDGSNVLSVKGGWFGTAPQTHEVAIHDPTLHFGRCLVAAFRQEGIAIAGSVRRPGASERQGGTEVVRLTTPLARVLPAMLKESQNHRAEMILKHLGAATGRGGSFKGGSEAVAESLSGLGVQLKDCVLMDGSGLSRSNRITARALYDALSIMGKRPDFEAYRDLLAEPGEEGTLRRRLPSLRNRMAGKTGTLNNVKTLSGYVLTKDQRWIAFVVLCNGPEAEGRGGALQDAVVEALAASGNP